jgi:hypothetical protein
MHTRGRYSAAALSTPLAVGPNGPREVLEPPDYFNAREREEWNAIVDRLGGDFFPPECRTLLASYVSISCKLEAITAQLSRFKGRGRRAT